MTSRGAGFKSSRKARAQVRPNLFESLTMEEERRPTEGLLLITKGPLPRNCKRAAVTLVYKQEYTTMRTRKSSRSPVTGHESSIWQCLVLIASWQLLVTPLNAFVPSSSSSSFNPLTHVKDPQRQGKQSSQQSSSTAVSMGIRSLLGIGKNKKNKHEKDSSSSSPFPPTSARPRTATNTTTETSQSTKDSDSSPTESSRPPLRMGEDPTTKEVDVFQQAGAESIQDKINRIKSGSMTSSEKQAFLESALSAGTTAESRKPLSEAADDKPKVSASPFPTDSILRNFARGKPAKDPAGLTSSSSTKTKDPEPRRKLDSDKKKQEYLDMVTNPDRFQRYKKSSSTSGAGTSLSLIFQSTVQDY